ncbi:cell division protein ZapA [Hansschlegelia beijingensis]|uniref:Cell division protein ZapA n=1 Tax=Hansschlegelia beijingensis TaxID=1133344 RepID=A0A7W6CUS3_9HYPH|nr:cell division protein ZapA [Hansschlegelia beijingensis]MBB3971483.1 cell division protein ZapA [Hansschlegelia beijingensis]
MPQVTVQIGGRDYKMACGEGEEQHLLSLARSVDERHAQLKRQFGEVGDIRLSIMTAIMMADELNEASRTRAELEAEIVALKAADQNAVEAFDARHADVAEQVSNAAARLERLAEELAEGVRRE